MPNLVRTGLLAVVLLVPATTRPQPMPPAIAAHLALLVAQCPAPPHPGDATAVAPPIHVTRWGSAGPRVLIIHGGVQGGAGGGPATFAGQRAWGEQGWRVELADRPGFGRSPTRGVDDMERDAGWIAAMLGDGANLIGHSWGGMEALLAAGRRPEAVHALVLIEPALSGVLTADPALRDNPAIRQGGMLRRRIMMESRTPAGRARPRLRRHAGLARIGQRDCRPLRRGRGARDGGAAAPCCAPASPPTPRPGTRSRPWPGRASRP